MFENTLNFPSAMLEVQLKLLSYTLFRQLCFKIIVIGRSKEHAPKIIEIKYGQVYQVANANIIFTHYVIDVVLCGLSFSLQFLFSFLLSVYFYIFTHTFITFFLKEESPN